MAKINISFNNSTYSIEESSLATAAQDLKTHLSTTMSGTGATIILDGTSYNVDSTKLSTAASDFTTYLNTISGSGYKVNVNGVDYDIDATKVASAVSGLCAIFDALESGGKNYSEGLEFISNGDGTCYVAGIGNCTDTDIIIPKVSPSEDKVTKIGKQSFYQNQNITSVVFPEGVLIIEGQAFQECNNLTSVVIPSSMTNINALAFYYCSNMTYAQFGNPDGWFISRSPSGIPTIQTFDKEALSDPATAATYLGTQYCAIHWIHSAE